MLQKIKEIIVFIAIQRTRGRNPLVWWNLVRLIWRDQKRVLPFQKSWQLSDYIFEFPRAIISKKWISIGTCRNDQNMTVQHVCAGHSSFVRTWATISCWSEIASCQIFQKIMGHLEKSWVESFRCSQTIRNDLSRQNIFTLQKSFSKSLKIFMSDSILKVGGSNWTRSLNFFPFQRCPTFLKKIWNGWDQLEIVAHMFRTGIWNAILVLKSIMANISLRMPEDPLTA